MRQENSKSNSTLPNACECLVILIFIGVMGGIAMPAFMSKVNKSKQSEAKQYVVSMNRAQQAKLAENGTFSFDALELGIKTEPKWYKYSIHDTKTAVFHYAVAKQPGPKNYVGGVFLVPAAPNAPKDAIRTSSTILCEADSLGTIKPAEPIYQNGKVVCGKGTTEVTR